MSKPTAVLADARSDGLGDALLQLCGEPWNPVAYCSRCITETETCYTKTENESQAGEWACKKFDMYVSELEQFTNASQTLWIFLITQSKNKLELCFADHFLIDSAEAANN